jgi:hypothetical protein
MKNEGKVREFLKDLYYTPTEGIDPYSSTDEVADGLLEELKEIMETEDDK